MVRLVLAVSLLAACGGGSRAGPGADAAPGADADAPPLPDAVSADAQEAYGFDRCDDSCLHNCRPYPRDVVDDGGIAPLADFYCLANEPSDDICSTCDRSLTLRVERGIAGGPLAPPGESGTPLVVPHDAAGTWPATGPAVPKASGTCYRTAARVELSNGYAAGWAYGSYTCF